MRDKTSNSASNIAISESKIIIEKPLISIDELIDKSNPDYRPSLQEEFTRLFDLTDSWKCLLIGLSFFHSVI
jgi:hypothetical protein